MHKSFNEKIRQEAPEVRLCPVSFIDFFTLNSIVLSKRMLLAGEHLWNVHPLLKFIPLEGNLLLPYGLYYSLNPSPAVALFLQTFQECGISGNIEDASAYTFRKEA